MRESNQRTWGLRAGKRGKAHDLFIGESVVALEDAEMRDLRRLEKDRATYYARYRVKHPDETLSGSAGVAGKFYRFCVDMGEGDWILYPALRSKQVYVGQLHGAYRFVGGTEFPHQRPVCWGYRIPKEVFSLEARYELGAARTLFAFKRNRCELMHLIRDDTYELKNPGVS